VNTCLSPYEEDYDKYNSEFEKVVELAKATLDLPEEYLCNNIGRFQFDMGLIPALHLVGTRCRVSEIRDECVRLLSKYHWREGLFDSFRSARFIQSCMDVEDAAKQRLMGLEPHELGDYLPCEGARVHFVGLEENELEDGTQLHSFYSKPYGAYGDWHIQQYYLPATLQFWKVEPTTTGIARLLPNTAFTMPNLYTNAIAEKSNGMFYYHLVGVSPPSQADQNPRQKPTGTSKIACLNFLPSTLGVEVDAGSEQNT
jgi:hypothetical protein